MPGLGLGLGVGIDVSGSTFVEDFSPLTAGHAIAQWRTQTGLRTSTSEARTITVEAFTKAAYLGDEGDLVCCDFYVSVNGGAAVPTRVRGRNLREGNYSAVGSPLPGVTAGKTAAVWGWSMSLNMAALDPGYVTVTAKVRTDTHETDVAGELTLYNDSDAGDRRPCTGTIYVSPVGDDGTGDGTEENPFLTLRHAVLALRPGGISADPDVAAQCDVGGGRIVAMAGEHTWAGGIAFPPACWHTSGDWWLEIECADGATFTRALTAPRSSDYPNGYFQCSGYGGGGFGGSGSAKVRMINAQVRGDGCVFYAGVPMTVWVDGGQTTSKYYSPGSISVRYWEDSTQTVSFDGPSVGSCRRIATCHTISGSTTGFQGWDLVQDCIVEDWSGVAFQSSTYPNNECNCLLRNHRFVTANQVSEVDGGLDNTWTAGELVVHAMVGGAHDGKMTIAHTSDPTGLPDLRSFGGLIGSTLIGAELRSFTGVATGTVAAVLEVGDVDSVTGLPFVVVDVDSFTEEETSVSNRMRTTIFSGSVEWTAAVHTDLHQWNGDFSETMHTHVGVRDVKNLQGWFAGGHTISDGVMFNVSDGGLGSSSGEVNNFVSATVTGMVIAHCTLTAPFDWSAGATVTGSLIFDNVFVSESNFPSSVGDHNHIVDGGSTGTNQTTGSWFASSPYESPWELTPAALVADSGRISLPSAWRHSGISGNAKGCLKNVATCNWAI